jgi:hypothetical protein
MIWSARVWGENAPATIISRGTEYWETITIARLDWGSTNAPEKIAGVFDPDGVPAALAS